MKSAGTGRNNVKQSPPSPTHTVLLPSAIGFLNLPLCLISSPIRNSSPFCVRRLFVLPTHLSTLLVFLLLAVKFFSLVPVVVLYTFVVLVRGGGGVLGEA